MTVEERISAADRRKMDGNAFFKEEKLEEAMQQYEMVQACVLECSYCIVTINISLCSILPQF